MEIRVFLSYFTFFSIILFLLKWWLFSRKEVCCLGRVSAFFITYQKIFIIFCRYISNTNSQGNLLAVISVALEIGKIITMRVLEGKDSNFLLLMVLYLPKAESYLYNNWHCFYSILARYLPYPNPWASALCFPVSPTNLSQFNLPGPSMMRSNSIPAQDSSFDLYDDAQLCGSATSLEERPRAISHSGSFRDSLEEGNEEGYGGR